MYLTYDNIQLTYRVSHKIFDFNDDLELIKHENLKIEFDVCSEFILAMVN